MASAEDAAGGARSSLGLPLIIAATFAAGAGAALAAKSVLQRRKDSVPTPAGADPAADEDLVGTLRRAALDVAIAATNEAAERLSVDEQADAQDAETSLQTTSRED